ncbi:MAG: tetratricopeptide repeat protein [Myxococcaceae bacterium]|nr:tetratricopeptide repeat protein [Myxococcaceae bacterium]MCA3017006.1 tetratricopeptide repeat protein [Myxococcaceae bacterium]
MSAALCACATDQVSSAERLELLASLRALRAENARVEARLDRLEADLKAVAAAAGRPGSGSPVVSPPAAAAAPVVKGLKEEMPALTVVKLKPRREAPPRLPTEVDVVEPPEAMAAEVSDTGGGTGTDAQVEEQFLAGLDALKTGDPESGITRLKQFAKDWPRHPKADNALYFAAVGMMASREFEVAESTLEQAVRQYPAGDATVDALLKLADCRARLNRHAEARATWEKIVATYPGTSAATTAQARLAAAPASLRKD